MLGSLRPHYLFLWTQSLPPSCFSSPPWRLEQCRTLFASSNEEECPVEFSPVSLDDVNFVRQQPLLSAQWIDDRRKVEESFRGIPQSKGHDEVQRLRLRRQSPDTCIREEPDTTGSDTGPETVSPSLPSKVTLVSATLPSSDPSRPDPPTVRPDHLNPRTSDTCLSRDIDPFTPQRFFPLPWVPCDDTTTRVWVVLTVLIHVINLCWNGRKLTMVKMTQLITGGF